MGAGKGPTLQKKKSLPKNVLTFVKNLGVTRNFGSDCATFDLDPHTYHGGGYSGDGVRRATDAAADRRGEGGARKGKKDGSAAGLGVRPHRERVPRRRRRRDAAVARGKCQVGGRARDERTYPLQRIYALLKILTKSGSAICSPSLQKRQHR